MQQVNQPLACDEPSYMLSQVLEFLTVSTADLTPDQLAVQIQVPGSWIRAIRENRSAKPNINRIEYIFKKYCGGSVETKKEVA